MSGVRRFRLKGSVWSLSKCRVIDARSMMLPEVGSNTVFVCVCA